MKNWVSDLATKYIVVAYIALGLVLSSIVSLVYECYGSDPFPEYYGSPFVFRRQSLGSSMEYFYSVSGMVLNVLVWSVPLLLIRAGLLKLIELSGRRVVSMRIYRAIVAFMIAMSTIVIGGSVVTMGRGFQQNRNYWYYQADREAKEAGANCEGRWEWLGGSRWEVRGGR